MAELVARGLFPFRLSWPKRPEEMGVIVLAAHSAAERKGWMKALEASIEIYQRGSQLRAFCDGKLRDAQMRIEKISDSGAGTQPLDEE